MRAFRPQSFRQRAASQAKRSDGLTTEQHRALLTEFDRRIASFKKKWRGCRDGRCRRHQQCVGPSLACNSNGGPPRWSKRLYRRLRRDIVRNPPRVAS